MINATKQNIGDGTQQKLEPHWGRQSGELVSKVKKKKRILEEAKRIKVVERSLCKGPKARNPVQTLIRS